MGYATVDVMFCRGLVMCGDFQPSVKGVTQFCAKWKMWVMCFLTSTFSNAPAHPLYFLTSP